MNLIDSLKTNFVAANAKATYQAPQNLNELRIQLRDACQRRELPRDLHNYCNWYSEYLAKVHDGENKTMLRTRGKARKMWAEQSLIYQDMIHLLKEMSQTVPRRNWSEIKEQTNTLYELVDEFSEALKEMEDWTRNEELRCLKCGWNGSSGHCPHCKVQVLKPIRNFSTYVNNYVTLAPLQSRIFDTLMAVLEGDRDVSALKAPLHALEQKYLETVEFLETRSQSELAMAGLANIEQGILGIELMRRVFQNSDAQHLEDGWAMIFQSDSSNQDLIETVPSSAQAVAAAYEIIHDSVSLSNE